MEEDKRTDEQVAREDGHDPSAFAGPRAEKVFTDKTPRFALTKSDMNRLTEEEAEALNKPHFIKQWLEANGFVPDNDREEGSLACDVEPILNESGDIIGISIEPVDGVGILHINC